MILPLNFVADESGIAGTDDRITIEFKAFQFFYYIRQLFPAEIFELKEDLPMDRPRFSIKFNESMVRVQRIENEIATFVPMKWMPIAYVPMGVTAKDIKAFFTTMSIEFKVTDRLLFISKVPLPSDVVDLITNFLVETYGTVLP